jgi:Glycosyltransferase family 92
VKAYLAVQAMFLNEARYLREWIEFHRLVGVERFFLYDHESTDSGRDVLAPYVEEGIVVVHDWPVHPGLLEANQDCIERHRADARWIAFMDIDEFLFSPTGAPVPDVLHRFDHLAGLGIPWALFGPSGHKTRPPGLVIESYTVRTSRPRRARWFKSMVDPTKVFRARGPHVFGYTHDRDLEPVPAFAPFELLRINHYWTKSEEEFAEKLARPWAHTGKPHNSPPERAETLTGGGFAVTDEAILQYLPALRDALTVRTA